MRILSIETSCDETGVALLEVKSHDSKTDVRVLGNGLLSQTSTHSPLGGVVPSLAKREHQNNLIPMLTLALKEANELIPETEQEKTFEDEFEKIFTHEKELKDALLKFLPTIKKPNIDCIAVTNGPGLEPALWVGINFGKALSAAWNVPLIPINHMEGHILSSLLKEEGKNHFSLAQIKYPLVSLLISGGHTELVLSKEFGHYEIIGKTQDDAVGEAFDKVARMLNLPYPGGPEISKLAEEARSKNIESTYTLPRPMLHTDNLHFSFSGLKTAVLYTLKKIPEVTAEIKLMIAREFEDAITEVLVSKVSKALGETGAHTLAVGGGVIANKHIREELTKQIAKEKKEIDLFLPAQKLTTDNAVMIGITAYFKSKKVSQENIIAEGNLELS